MAWGGRAGRLSGRYVKNMYRMWRRPPPDMPLPNSIPTSVMRKLQQEMLPADQLDTRLQQLLKQYREEL